MKKTGIWMTAMLLGCAFAAGPAIKVSASDEATGKTEDSVVQETVAESVEIPALQAAPAENAEASALKKILDRHPIMALVYPDIMDGSIL